MTEAQQKLLKQIHQSTVLTMQEKRTLRGQVLIGDTEQAAKGYERILRKAERMATVYDARAH